MQAPCRRRVFGACSVLIKIRFLKKRAAENHTLKAEIGVRDEYTKTFFSYYLYIFAVEKRFVQTFDDGGDLRFLDDER